VIEFDPEKVRQNGPGAVRMLGRLANAIILQQKLGVEFDRSIKVEMGDAVALLVNCVKKETDDAIERTTTGQESGSGGGGGVNISPADCVQSQPGFSPVAAKRLPQTGPRVRGESKPADPSKGEKR